MTVQIKTIVLLIISNSFMLTAWYLHLKVPFLNHKPLIFASIFSWSIAFFEYLFHIPANRIGAKVFNLEQLQILQIGISLVMFIPFAMLIMKQPFKWDYLYASFFLFLAAYFIFRN